jgi:hypothetical protein
LGASLGHIARPCLKKSKTSIQNAKGWEPVAHVYNPSYSGGKDQEDHDLKPAQGNSLQDPISKILNTKKWLVEWPKC